MAFPKSMIAAGLVALAIGTPATAEGKGDAPALVPIDMLKVPIVDGARTTGTLRLKLTLQARDAGAATRLTAALPRLRAASLMAVMDFARLYASPLMPLDAAKLAECLNGALRAQDPGVAKVLVTELQATAS